MARKAAVRRGRKNSGRPEKEPELTAVPEAALPEQEAPEQEAPEQEAPEPEAPEQEAPEQEAPEQVPDAGALRTPVSQDTMRIPAYLLDAEDAPASGVRSGEIAETVRALQHDVDALAWRKQEEDEARERAEIEERQRRVEEEQARLRARVKREVRERTAAEKKRLREEQEARIEEEVEKRLREAEEEAVPQIIFSPRMERARRATVFWIVAGVVALALVSIVLGIRNDRLRRQLAEQGQQETVPADEASENGESQNPGSGDGQPADDPVNESVRSVYLTFDDGPSRVTAQVLDILKQYDVRATFFVVGRVDEESRRIYRRIVDEGHTLAMHSYTHNYAQIYESLDSFQADMHKLQNLLYEETGVWCKVFRFPGGSSNAASRVDMNELIAYLDREEVTYYDWNVYGGDDISPEIMQSNVFANVEKYDNAVILLHDAADKEETVEALPGIIEYIKGLDRTQLLPITDDTIPVQHGGKTP